MGRNPGAAALGTSAVRSSVPSDEATALRDDIKTLNARAVNWQLTKSGAKRWGENVEANYDGYLKFLVKWGVVKEAVPARQIIFNGWGSRSRRV